MGEVFGKGDGDVEGKGLGSADILVTIIAPERTNRKSRGRRTGNSSCAFVIKPANRSVQKRTKNQKILRPKNERRIHDGR